MRLKFIDGLRGLAALMVATLHVSHYTIAHRTYGLTTDDAVGFLALGVQVFFVVSGFALRHSIGDAQITWGYTGRFALRRSLRIDPPYWFAIAVIVGINVFVSHYVGERYEWTWGQVAAHITYTQGILGVKPISGVFWSLCIEVQFYVFLLALLWVAQRTRLPFGLLTLPLLAVSLATISPIGGQSSGDVFDVGVSLLPNYALFYLGTMAAERSKWLYVGAIACVAGLAFRWTNELAVGVLTAGMIDIACWDKKMGQWLAGPVIQFFGKISYSLYLIHTEIAWLTYLAMKTVAPNLNLFVAFAACFCAATAAATAMHYAVERPTHKLAKRIHLRTLPVVQSSNAVVLETGNLGRA